MRNVRVATISFRHSDDVYSSLNKALALVDQAARAQPDIIALPEACVNSRRTAQPVPGPITEAMAKKARAIGCYLIVPLIRQGQDGSLYNVAVLLDPAGQVTGEYVKMFPTDYEMADGIIPGESTPVFDTSFGRIGMAICFDLNFSEVIAGLAAGEAEIVFFLSAYEGGRQLESWALEHSVYVVSSHRGGIGYVVDKSGYVLQKGDGAYNPVVVRDLNLDREILHLDYNREQLGNITAAYGKAVHIDVYRPEAIFALESRDPSVSVRQIMKEYGLESYKEYMTRSRRLRKARLRGEDVKAGPAK